MRSLLVLIAGLFGGNAWAWLQGADPWPLWGILVAMLATGTAGLVVGSRGRAHARSAVAYIPPETADDIRVWPIRGGHVVCVRRPLRRRVETSLN